jgi:chorismate mutase
VSESGAKDPALRALRDRIDDVDRRLLELLKERMGVVADVARHKRSTGVRIRDLARERELLDSRRVLAEQLGLGGDSVERQDRTPHRSTGLDPRGLHELFGRLLASVAHFQVGSIIEREGDLLRRRALAEPIPSPFGPPGDGRP